ncbi:MAG: type IV pilin protein [Gammaproteobacteria bacterium]|jgi:type IV pilus assembly protein PilE
MFSKRTTGFTIMELLIAIAVLGILAALAIPAYQGNMQSSRRTDGITALLDVQAQQTQWRANNVTYAATLTTDLGWANSVSPEGYYTISLSNVTATTYTATATPKVGGPQESDSCGNLVLTESGPDISTDQKKSCWKK